MLRRIRLMATLTGLVMGLVTGLGITGAAFGAMLHDEGIQGDLSGDRLAPTVHTLAAGTNSVVAGMGPGDLEYLTLALPAGLKLDQIILADFTGDSFVSFIAVERAANMSVLASTPSAAGLLGWAHLTTVGGDVLAVMGSSGSGATGFVPPLAAGTYAFWLQEIDAPVASPTVAACVRSFHWRPWSQIWSQRRR